MQTFAIHDLLCIAGKRSTTIFREDVELLSSRPKILRKRS